MIAAPLLFLYGSLRRGGSAYVELGLATRLRLVQRATVRGRLYDLGPYPAFVPGDGLVHGDLFEAADAAILADLDAFEEYDPANPAASLYVREPIAVVGAPLEAFIYRYNGAVDGFPEIASGDWIAHRSSREGAT